MKQQPLLSVSQGGFTLIESLIALLLFAIIVLGSSAAIKHMLSIQKDMNISFIVVNEMQNRLQGAHDKTDVINVCDRVLTTPYEINSSQKYYFGCSTKKISAETKTIEWPVLAVSTTSATVATNCAKGIIDPTCYVVGR
ncbi:type II secretion system protein [Acinetobacter schindleri]|jgi:prepilin-type N-terminal cleavage/methylation domain-containing protein|uniref:type II secretion system protein n=1 Tax=Acinetobacter schindleri TaxID=108981 RepID=UPI0013B08B32|nr:type II secretion system protein [Acinetobacter schindleri]MBB4836724.1 prepilin-type N-terminal cleavage/methylation domain-containing protein [Acinetobacter schindleri]QIC64963.1 prepilin-type N-terminal cleavage/methylation domain-containing protein [Acinetobacter schindleri]WBX37468.1 prepilin-type N-terminal cleavage/methylation domain-containing protein [Acinetobacter schindleri]WDE15474.1 prepilin-type N-terminal cleavage/methylation domain-containing protein [Acinetobacter schindleri